ncbi:acid protease [Thozetella sp. PMI_491]|nr:acid protease [Thozetella sp. PMI_491]
MHRCFLATVISLAATVVAQEASVERSYISYPVTRVVRESSDVIKRQSSADLDNFEGAAYLIDLVVGTPGQHAVVQLDTGSDEMWIAPVCGTDVVCNQLPKFDAAQSTTITNLHQNGSIIYGLGSVRFTYYTDYVTSGSAKIKGQQFGVAYQNVASPFGVLGVGPITSPSEVQYDRFITTLAKQGITQSRAFSLDLRDYTDNGTIIFGGIDTKKYTGSLAKLPIASGSGNRYYLTLGTVGVTRADGSASQLGSVNAAALLDSGTTVSFLPTAIVAGLVREFGGGTFISSVGSYRLTDCSSVPKSGTLDYTFGTKVIKVPYNDFVWASSATGYCYMDIIEIARLPSLTFPILGDAFLRAAYVVYDQDNNNIHIAQAANCGSNIVAISSGPDAVPSTTGDCGSSPSSTQASSSASPSSSHYSTTSTASSRSATGTSTTARTVQTTTTSSISASSSGGTQAATTGSLGASGSSSTSVPSASVRPNTGMRTSTPIGSTSVLLLCGLVAILIM